MPSNPYSLIPFSESWGILPFRAKASCLQLRHCDTLGELMKRSLVLGLLCLALNVDAAPTFNSDIRPILSGKCFACHGPDAKARKGKLRLDLREEAVKAIEPGNPDASELIRRVEASDVDEIMPPPETHKKVSVREISLLREWIAAGAEYEGHWSFLPIRDPEAPQTDSEWPRKRHRSSSRCGKHAGEPIWSPSEFGRRARSSFGASRST